ncbi:helix-turn-helix transcriptional regulator [Paenibacillus sp. LS1]|uniref:winged helix-turn-helix transcriptional regulator n=1 Tax=Paenibacillus sp. LS1 TaxID=2992120 RepID=UPI00222E4680|nr:helix-turn-helix domain-containing protein [Paenibacillus sp. LS1]MCW3794437.1 helix-turn-helix transcriptional regulator [Paenibacillus sp. LS1]
MEEKKDYVVNCALNKVQKVIGGKWKLLILWYLLDRPKRFGEIKRAFPDTTQSMLTKQLRELEEDNLVHREVFKEVPPHVEYSLTNLGKGFVPILESMNEWGQLNLN